MKNPKAPLGEEKFFQNNEYLSTFLEKETPFNPQNFEQEFYKTFSRRFKNQILLKHGYRLFSFSREEQDLVRFCMAILQAEAKFPLKVKFYTSKKQPNIKEQNVWIQTQILMSSLTVDEKMQKQSSLFQQSVYSFFTQKLIPNLRKFKEAKINWEYMCSNEYVDTKVVNEFDEKIIQTYNSQFRKQCIQRI